MAIRERNDPQSRDAAYVLKRYFQVTEDPSQLALREFVLQVWSCFHMQETIGQALKYLVHRSAGHEELERWSQVASAAIGIASEPNANWQQAIFVDGIDEALGDPYGESLFNGLRLGNLVQRSLEDKPGSASSLPAFAEDVAVLRTLALQVLLHAQTGFIQAADEIRTEFRSLRCYGAVRQEAAEWFLDPTKTGKQAAKVDGTLLTRVEYQKDQLDAIFELNVHYSDEDTEIADRKADNASKRLYGFRAIQHSSVLGSDGVEEMRDLLIRHTFGVPRQLVSLAKATLDAVPVPALRRQRVDDIVDAIDSYAATTMWADYISSVNPPWFDERATGMASITQNILDEQELAHLDRDFPGLVSFLYSRGMLGRPVGRPGSTVLEFHRANGAEVKLPPKCEYVVVHPVLSACLCRDKSPEERHSYYVSDFIVGHGLACPRKVARPLMRVSYEGDLRWTFEAQGKPIDFGNIVGPGENPLLTEKESTRAAVFLLLIVALAMKRHKAEWVTLAQMHTETQLIKQIMGSVLSIHNRASTEYVNSRLVKTGQIEELQILNRALQDYGIGISKSDDNDDNEPASRENPFPGRRFSLRQEGAERRKGPKAGWRVLPPAMISVRLVQPRVPID
jgi:hypothetical protein